MASLFKSEIGKREILGLYDEKLKELNITYQYQSIETSFGETNIIVTGHDKLPPLIIVHGSNGCAPIGLDTFPNLSTKFQVFAVDVIGQPNKSAGTVLSMKDNSYGAWMNELIDKLKIDQVVLVGFSFGGLIILKTLLDRQEKIKEVFLAAPAYIVNGNPLVALWKIFIPMKRYMKSGKVKFVEQFLNELFTEKDNFAIRFLSKVFLEFKMDFTPVPVIGKNEAMTIQTPITLIAAGKDIMFPGEKMIKKAKNIFPSLKETVLLVDSKHVQNKVDNSRIELLIMK